MKKISFIILFICFVFTLSSCNKEETEEDYAKFNEYDETFIKNVLTYNEPDNIVFENASAYYYDNIYYYCVYFINYEDSEPEYYDLLYVIDGNKSVECYLYNDYYLYNNYSEIYNNYQSAIKKGETKTYKKADLDELVNKYYVDLLLTADNYFIDKYKEEFVKEVESRLSTKIEYLKTVYNADNSITFIYKDLNKHITSIRDNYFMGIDDTAYEVAPRGDFFSTYTYSNIKKGLANSYLHNIPWTEEEINTDHFYQYVDCEQWEPYRYSIIKSNSTEFKAKCEVSYNDEEYENLDESIKQFYSNTIEWEISDGEKETLHILPKGDYSFELKSDGQYYYSFTITKHNVVTEKTKEKTELVFNEKFPWVQLVSYDAIEYTETGKTIWGLDFGDYNVILNDDGSYKLEYDIYCDITIYYDYDELNYTIYKKEDRLN